MGNRAGARAAGKKKWYMFWADVNRNIDENADPKTLMYQVMQAAKDDDVRLRASAAKVIGNQRKAEMLLNDMIDELEELQKKTTTALKMEAATTDDPAKKAQFSAAAKQLYTKLESKKKEVERQKAIVLGATQAASQAEEAVKQNSLELEQAMSKQQELLAANDQAEMQEEMNAAMATLNSNVSDGVTPTFGEVEARIRDRMGNAMGAATVGEIGSGRAMAAIDAAALEFEADAGLEAMRAELGLTTGTPSAPALSPSSTPADATDPAAAQESAPKRKSFDPNALK